MAREVEEDRQRGRRFNGWEIRSRVWSVELMSATDDFNTEWWIENAGDALSHVRLGRCGKGNIGSGSRQDDEKLGAAGFNETGGSSLDSPTLLHVRKHIGVVANGLSTSKVEEEDPGIRG